MRVSFFYINQCYVEAHGAFGFRMKGGGFNFISVSSFFIELKSHAIDFLLGGQ